jgi:hypothetical protein
MRLEMGRLAVASPHHKLLSTGFAGQRAGTTMGTID